MRGFVDSVEDMPGSIAEGCVLYYFYA
jgi:hypothetical protein